MLANIYVVYCILKCICHRSYIEYHFILSHFVSYYAIYVQFQSVNFLQYICWDVNVYLSLNLDIMDAMDIVIDIVCLCV